MMALLAAVYIWLVAIAARKPDLEVDDPKAEKIVLPQVKDIYSTGLHYVLPIVVLVWFLMVERQSPARSAFFATSLMIGIIATQRPLKALFRGAGGADVVRVHGRAGRPSRRADRGGAQHDRHRRGHGGRRHHRGHRHPHTHRHGNWPVWWSSCRAVSFS